MLKKLLTLLLVLTLITPLYADNNWGQTKPPLGSQIDWGHPLSRGLTFCCIINNNNWDRKGINLVDRQVPVISGTLYTRITPKSFCSRSNSVNTSYLRYAKVNTIPRGQITVVAEARRTSNTFSPSYVYLSVVGATKVGATRAGYLLELSNYYQTGKQLKIFSEFYDGASSSTNYMYVNGVKQTSASESNVALPVNTFATIAVSGNAGYVAESNYHQLFAAAYGAFNDFGGFAEISYYYVYNRYLTPQEIQQLYQEPYCFIKPPTVWSKFSTAVGEIIEDFSQIFIIN